MRRLVAVLCLITACRETPAPPPLPAARPSILLVTLDTTRADAIGPEAKGIDTPAFNALAARGTRFRYAYATAPQTLPSHASMMTGFYPGGHGIHENARYLSPQHPLIAARLREAGYRTAAFVSAFVLARQFGLARGFETYDDEFPPGESERSAAVTTDRAIAWLNQTQAGPFFVWVHYFDPHHPYEPPEPFRARYSRDPYRGEVAAMDEQLGRLVTAFERRAGPQRAIIVAGDHGESLGEHGEAQHGNLLYQPAMRVPLVAAGPGFGIAVSDSPASVRRVFHTIAAWAGLDSDLSLARDAREVVLGEAMKPFLQYGWQPQIMAVDGSQKAIQAGRLEVYDVARDPGETRDISGQARLSRELRKAIIDYPIPSPAAQNGGPLTDEDRRRLASLGYVSSSARPVIRNDAPRPADMAHLFGALDRASGLFTAGEYAAVIPLLEKILAEDRYNLDSLLRLAVAHSSLGHEAKALAAFERARTISPQSPDVRVYLALHLSRSSQWQRAVPMLEQIVAQEPDRLPAVEALAIVRERQGRLQEALDLRQRLAAARKPTPADLTRLGQLAMAVGQTTAAIEAFEKARAADSGTFRHDLELGVLYLAARRFDDARAALDRVAPSHPEYPMALFKRAQVSVLLGEPDRAARIAAARKHSNETTRPLIAAEKLFQ